MRIVDGNIACVHGRGQFVAVGAVADEGVVKTGTMGWLGIEEYHQSRVDKWSQREC